MAYEKLELVTAFMSGQIYLANIKKDGTMSDSRRIMTDDVLRAAAEWFATNKKKAISFGSREEDKHPHLFFTADPEKAKRIVAILKEGEENDEKTV